MTSLACLCLTFIIHIHTSFGVNTPQAIVPYPNQNLTDVAIHFRFWGCDKCTTYQFQLSPSINFPNDAHLIDIKTPPDNQNNPPQLWTSVPGINSYFPPLFGQNKLPSPGIWYYRIKGFVNVTNQPSAWSNPVKIIINNDHEPADHPTLPITISEKSPLFDFEIWDLTPSQVQNFNKTFPSNLLKNYIALDFSLRKDKNETLLHEFLMPAIENNIPLVISTEAGPNPVSIWESLAEVEYMFQT